MNKVKNFFIKHIDAFREKIVHDDMRVTVLYRLFDVAFALVAAFMSVVNVFSQKWLLLCFTAGFTVACLLNLGLSYINKVCRIFSYYLFLSEALVLCTAFCITGTPEGFSALWICFIPSFSLTVLGLKKGSLYSGLGCVIIIFLFWTPWGKQLLQYQYTGSFMLRFPMIYTAFYVLSFILELVRSETQRKLRESEHRFQSLYNHDSLTGVLNRYGFNEKLAEMCSSKAKTVTLMMVDLDNFKQINDIFGHDVGDKMLQCLTQTMIENVDENTIVSRWGGEEFTVIATDLKNPLAVAEKIRNAVANLSITENGQTIGITISIGVCTTKGKRSESSAAQLVRMADKCLYRAKEDGRNNVKVTEI